MCKNVDLLAEMIQEHDEPVLKHLTDVRVRFQESEPEVRGRRGRAGDRWQHWQP